jgi:hypothetical protein
MVAEEAAGRGSIGLRCALARVTQATRFSRDVARRPGREATT